MTFLVLPNFGNFNKNFYLTKNLTKKSNHPYVFLISVGVLLFNKNKILEGSPRGHYKNLSKK